MGWKLGLLGEILDGTSSNRKESKQEIEYYKECVESTMAEADGLRKGEFTIKQNQLNKKSKQIQKLIKSHMEMKKQMLHELGTDIEGTLTKFKEFNIDQYVIDPLDVDIASAVATPSLEFGIKKINANMVAPSFDIFSLFSLFDNPEKDLEKVKEAYATAKKYLSEIRYAITQIENTSSKLDNIANVIDDEKNALSELMDKIIKITPQLDNAMKKDRFRRVEADYLKKLANIAEILKSSMEDGLLDSNGNINDNYRLYLDKMKRINDEIPQEPKIETERTFLEKILGW